MTGSIGAAGVGERAEVHPDHALDAADLTERFGPPAPKIAAKVQPRLTDWMRSFIQRSPFVLVATSDAQGGCDVSPKGGAPGFVAILDDQTLLVPDYPGNNLFFGHKNILQNPRLALLFLLPGEGWVVRVNGWVELVDDPASMAAFTLSPRGEQPRLGLKVHLEECFSHCPKALTRSDLWNPANHDRCPKT